MATERLNANATIASIWGAVLNTPDNGKLWSRVGLVYGLPREIQRQLQRRPDYDDHEMAWWEPLSYGLTRYGARESWSYVHGVISADVLGAIRSRAKTLSHYFPEPVVQDSIIQELHEHIASIKAGMENESTVDEDLANFLSQRLERMEDLLDDIKIVGAVGVKQAVDTIVDEVNAKSEEMKETVSPQTWEWWERLLKRTQTVFATLAVVSGGIGSATMTTKALTSGPPQLEDAQQLPQEQSRRELPPSTQDASEQDSPVDANFKEVGEKDKGDGDS